MPEPEERQAVEELLPFYANGSLGDEETARVERALSEDAGLQAELEFLRALRGVVQSSRPEGVGELGARRLVRSVRKEKRRSFVQRTVVPLAVAASLLIVAQAVTIGVLSSGSGTDVVRPLGEAAELQVIFAPEATESEIRELLLSTGATIVDGPSALGVYRLDADDPDAALERLRARDDLVSHVAREGPGG